MVDFLTDVVSLASRGANPSAVSGSGKFFTKNMSGVSQLFYQDSNSTVYQLTPVTLPSGSVAFSQTSTMLTVGPGNTIPNAKTSSVDVFVSGSNTITLESSSSYRWTAMLSLERATTATNTYQLFFTGSANFSFFEYLCHHSEGNLTYFSSSQSLTTPYNLYPAGSEMTPGLYFEGFMTTISSGTLTPKIQASGGTGSPGTTTTIHATSFMEVILLGSNTYKSQGGWS